MLLFTATSVDVDPATWQMAGTYGGGDLFVEAGVGVGQHLVLVRSADGERGVVEVVSPKGLAVDDEPVSSFHLPPYYRWECGGFSCVFTAEWRVGAASLAVSLRHIESLRRHPRALIAEAPDGLPLSVIVASTPAPRPEQPAVDWRGWHVVDVDDPFDGRTRRILATHTAVFWGQVPPSTTLRP